VRSEYDDDDDDEWQYLKPFVNSKQRSYLFWKAELQGFKTRDSMLVPEVLEQRRNMTWYIEFGGKGVSTSNSRPKVKLNIHGLESRTLKHVERLKSRESGKELSCLAA